MGRVWIGRKEVALGTVEGPPEGDRATLKISKAKGIKSTSQRNQSQLELSRLVQQMENSRQINWTLLIY